MGYIGKDPRFRNPILEDVLTGTPSNPPSGTNKLVNRNGALFLRNSSGVEIPVGGGAGEKNYILSPSTAVGWTASISAITASTDTTAADLPRALTTKTGLLVTGVSGSTAYVYYRFTLDAVDYNRKLKIKLDMKALSGYVNSDFKVDLYSNTASDYSGTSTRIPTSSDISGICALPNMTGQFQTSVDMPGSSAPYMELRIGLNAASTQSVVFSDIVVGPGIQPQGSIVGPWLSYSAVLSSGFGTPTNVSFFYRQVGSTYDIRGYFNSGTVASAVGTLSLPNGYNIDTTVIPGDNKSNFGVYHRLASSATSLATADYTGAMVYEAAQGSNVLMFDSKSISNAYGPNNVSSIFSTGEGVAVHIVGVPIAQLANAGVVNIAKNDVEYASNFSSSTTSDDLTSFAYGPAGSLIQSVTATLKRRCRFQSPIQSGDQIKLQVFNGIDWLNLDNAIFYNSSGGRISPFSTQNSTNYGIGALTAVNQTDIDVYFGAFTYPTGATYGANGEAFSNAWNAGYWRLVKIAAGSALGFGQASNVIRGLMYDRKMYVVGTSYTNGTPGMTSAATGFAVSRAVLIPYQTFDGAWWLKCQAYITCTNQGGGPGSISVALSGVTFKNAGGGAYNAPVRSLSTTGSALPGASSAISNSGNVTLAWPSGQTSFSDCNFEFEAELNGKPTWAD